ELKLYGWKLSKQTPADLADKNFNYNKNLGVEKLEKLYKEKISQISQNFIKLEALSLATKTKENAQSFQREKELYIWQKSLDDMVDEVII
ncbi:TPA: hypothetical protein RHB69_001792, partial [Campylobacter jejuni]|nr:hypothetical protein [Campylobacter jejuni]HDU9300904.1 hypothetical protein [Campylobacter jejuni]